MRKLVLVVLLALGLSGCPINPNYTLAGHSFTDSTTGCSYVITKRVYPEHVDGQGWDLILQSGSDKTKCLEYASTN